jgi:hypothetical protein
LKITKSSAKKPTGRLGTRTPAVGCSQPAPSLSNIEQRLAKLERMFCNMIELTAKMYKQVFPEPVENQPAEKESTTEPKPVSRYNYAL